MFGSDKPDITSEMRQSFSQSAPAGGRRGNESPAKRTEEARRVTQFMKAQEQFSHAFREGDYNKIRDGKYMCY